MHGVYRSVGKTRPRHDRARTARLVAALCLLPLLDGCVAAALVAVPTLGAYGAVKDHEKRQRAAAETLTTPPAPATDASATLAPAPVQALSTSLPRPAGSADLEGAGQALVLTELKELPAPSGPAGDAPDRMWSAFADYALGKAGTRNEKSPSALLTPESPGLLTPRLRPCGAGEPAVVIDLDREKEQFDPQPGLRASPGIVADLARLRAAGIVVMWVSSADPNRIVAIADALRSSGLDPAGRDPILLTLGEGDRKQTLREQAAARSCVLAIAGDTRADFDELFAYLRDPSLATAFDSMLGKGWFLVPDALGEP